MGRIKTRKVASMSRYRRRLAKRQAEKEKKSAMVELQDLTEALMELRAWVENQGPGKVRLVNGVYQSVDHTEIQSTKVGEWEFGYQVVPAPTLVMPERFRRRIYILLKGEDLSEVPDEIMADVLSSVAVAMIDQGNDKPKTYTWPQKRDVMVIEQYFAPAVIEEQNSLVVPGRTGKVL
jgi:hypothetical protein